MRSVLFALPLLAASYGGLSPSGDGLEEGAARGDLALYVSPLEHDFSGNPELLERIRSSAFAYFRFVNKRFAQAVCEDPRVQFGVAPTVNLHGDAHLEQYTITPNGRGLMDFDDSSNGPAVIDLFRFGVSVHIAADTRGWGEHKRAFLDEFARGYRAALENPEQEVPIPSIVRRVRASFQADRQSILASAESVMVPPPETPTERQRYEEDIRLFEESLTEQHPELPSDFFGSRRQVPFSSAWGAPSTRSSCSAWRGRLPLLWMISCSRPRSSGI